MKKGEIIVHWVEYFSISLSKFVQNDDKFFYVLDKLRQASQKECAIILSSQRRSCEGTRMGGIK